MIGFAVTLCIFLWLSISSGMKAGAQKDSKKKQNGSSALVVSGAIIGTLVGGSSTIGTAQLAYTYGFSAWWFTLGSGIGCLVLGLIFVRPLRRDCKNTLTGMVKEHYGPGAGLAATLYSTLGMYISMLAQLISAAAIVMMILPQSSLLVGVFISAVLMVLYALSGGVAGIGKIGVFKTILLYITAIGGGLMAVRLFGGVGALVSNPVLQEGHYFGFFNRGVGNDLGNVLSVVLGILCTQTYAQAVLAGKTESCARKGALLSAVMIPPIGLGGILIGMYMRVHHPDLTLTKFALPQFVSQNMPGPLAGVIFATLLITSLGTGAGLALGISTTIQKDVLQNDRFRISETVKTFLTERKLISITLLTTVVIASSGVGDFILDFSFMSMALRAASIFIPLLFALFVKKPIHPGYLLAAIVSGPMVVLVGSFVNLPFDPLFLGILANLLLVLAGCQKAKP